MPVKSFSETSPMREASDRSFEKRSFHGTAQRENESACVTYRSAGGQCLALRPGFYPYYQDHMRNALVTRTRAPLLPHMGGI
jgi:hypothetical protein